MRSKASPKQTKRPSPRHAKIHFYLPPGVKLNDVFIDGQQVIEQLFIDKRTLTNWRSDGRITFTKRFGKIFYFKQEIARLLIEGRQVGNRAAYISRPQGKQMPASKKTG